MGANVAVVDRNEFDDYAEGLKASGYCIDKARSTVWAYDRAAGKELPIQAGEVIFDGQYRVVFFKEPRFLGRD